MVVVADARAHIGRSAEVAVDSVIPSAGGKMLFARILKIL
jgi:uncharacterized protein YacL